MRGSIVIAVLLLTASFCVSADWGLVGGGQDITEIPLSARDAYSEYWIHRTLASDHEVDQRARVRAIAFGKTFLILGDVPSRELRDRVDALVLRATGVKRLPERVETAVVQRRDCGRRSPAVNTKRRFNRAGAAGGCGLLKGTDREVAPAGWVYNEVLVQAGRGAAARAADRLLRARVQAALVGQGFEQAIDDRHMKLDAQNGVVFLLGSPGTRETERMVEAAGRLDGVERVVVYPEKQTPDSRI